MIAKPLPLGNFMIADIGIEDTSGCRLRLDDFDLERFRSVDTMAAFLGEVGVAG